MIKQCKMVLLFGFLIPSSLCGQDIIYEAEYGTLTGSVSVQTSQPGYSGNGYVGRFENEGDKVTVSIDLEYEGYYDLYIGYAAPFGQKINNLVVNGNGVEVSFESATVFSEVAFGRVHLQAGNNRVSILKNWGWILVDYFRIEPNTDPGIGINIPYVLSCSGSMDETERLFQYLMDSFGYHIHSGTMSLDAIEEAEWLFTQTGRYPSLIGLDFMNHTREWDWFNKDILVNEARNWYHSNGLVSVCWHWRDPSRSTDDFYSSGTSFDVSKVSDTLSLEYQAMLTDIDIIAGYIKELQDSSIPLLFRPLHEASGQWFWWGAKGPEPCKALWKLIYNRLVYEHGLRNMIWVWTTDTRADNLDWYPGDEYVDILGVDIYTDNGDFSSQVLSYDRIIESFHGKKLIALTENGVVPDPDNLIADHAGWSWFMTWYGDFVRNPEVNPISHWQHVLDHDYVITLDEMPDLRNYVSGARNVEIRPYHFSLFPNPVVEYLHISPQEYITDYDVYVFDISGREIYSSKHNVLGISVSFYNFEAGIYLVKLSTADRSLAYKVIKL